MSELTRSIVVDVPLEFADQEWSEFVFRSLMNWYRIGPDEFSYDSAGDESEAESGSVYLESVDDGHTKVSVDLSYIPHIEDEPESDEVAHVKRHLDAQLLQYKRFVEVQYAKRDR